MPIREKKKTQEADYCYDVANMQGMGSRNRQEDSFSFINAFDKNKIKKAGMAFIVCDGMGGMQDGKLASETANNSIRNMLSKINKKGDINKQLEDILFEVSKEVEKLLGGEGGTTAIVCFIYQNKLYYVSVGDSYLILYRDGYLYKLNHDHNVCNQIFLECIDEGCLNPRDGLEDSESTFLTQFLGMTGLSQVDRLVKPLPLLEGDIILACSDGIGGTLANEQYIYSFSAGSSKEMCERLEESVLLHGKRNQDNYTAVIVNCCKADKEE